MANLNKTIVYAGGGIIILLLSVLILRQHHAQPVVATPMPIAAGTIPAGDLATNSTDPELVGFVTDFVASSRKSCKAKFMARAAQDNQVVTDAVSDRVDRLCDCSARTMVSTITVADARKLIAETTAGVNPAANPTLQAILAKSDGIASECRAKLHD